MNHSAFDRPLKNTQLRPIFITHDNMTDGRTQMFKKFFHCIALLLFAIAYVGTASAATSCLDQRIKDFHSANGPEYPLTHDVYKEFQRECNKSSGKSAASHESVEAELAQWEKQYKRDCVESRKRKLRDSGNKLDALHQVMIDKGCSNNPDYQEAKSSMKRYLNHKPPGAPIESQLDYNSVDLAGIVKTTHFYGRVQHNPMFQIVSRAGYIKVDDIVVNHGQCDVRGNFPVYLFYGEKKQLWLSTDCNLIEAKLKMNDQWFDYKFRQSS
ncbi:hypothetical protein [Salinisphaera sp. LB1]|uniref:hypothetical protein n=1 Tax=Salinisphaera sp. LB1 TaxID=2183911 RepID=UPI0011AB778E|nr:hypothetical protein [Salinisphaera sp. LB1]